MWKHSIWEWINYGNSTFDDLSNIWGVALKVFLYPTIPKQNIKLLFKSIKTSRQGKYVLCIIINIMKCNKFVEQWFYLQMGKV